MPCRLDAHVLVVDANVIHKVDTGNPTNLSSMWTVFSQCAGSVDQGRRLENLSWRLWQRETFDCQSASNSISSQTLPQNIPSESCIPSFPQLSGSVKSLTDEEADDFTTVPTFLGSCCPRIRIQGSCTSSRSKRERHISSENFEKMVISIVKDKGPLSAPPRSCPVVAPLKESLPAPIAFERSGSTNTESESPSRSISDRSEASTEPSPMTPSCTTIVRGFSTYHVPVLRTISSAVQCAPFDRIPEPTSSPAPKPVQSKKPPTKLTLSGASFSSTERDQSLNSHEPVIPNVKRLMFQIGGSSEDDASSKSTLATSPPSSLFSLQNSQASSSTNITSRSSEDEAAVDSKANCIDERAIDDVDDPSNWEDYTEDSGKSSVDDKFFQRVDSKPNLSTRRSLITLMLAKNDRARNLGNHASQSTSAIPRSRMALNEPSLGASRNESDESDETPLMMKGVRHPTLKPIHEIPRSSPQSIHKKTDHAENQAALSPRTTRRNMLSTELTESLRRHLLWERQQKSSTADAVLKRRHTSGNVTKNSHVKKSDGANPTIEDEPFPNAQNGYHSKGW